MDLYAVRFSLILQLLKWACAGGGREFIGLDAVEGAIKLVEYFKKEAIKVLNLIVPIHKKDRLNHQQRSLYSALPETFSTGEGLEIAQELSIKERTYKRFIADQELFRKESHGKYSKR